MTMITPSYLGETIEYSSLHACRSTLEDPTPEWLNRRRHRDAHHRWDLRVYRPGHRFDASLGATGSQPHHRRCGAFERHHSDARERNRRHSLFGDPRRYRWSLTLHLEHHHGNPARRSVAQRHERRDHRNAYRRCHLQLYRAGRGLSEGNRNKSPRHRDWRSRVSAHHHDNVDPCRNRRSCLFANRRRHRRHAAVQVFAQLHQQRRTRHQRVHRSHHRDAHRGWIVYADRRRHRYRHACADRNAESGANRSLSRRNDHDRPGHSACGHRRHRLFADTDSQWRSLALQVRSHHRQPSRRPLASCGRRHHRNCKRSRIRHVHCHCDRREQCDRHASVHFNRQRGHRSDGHIERSPRNLGLPAAARRDADPERSLPVGHHRNRNADLRACSNPSQRIHRHY